MKKFLVYFAVISLLGFQQKEKLSIDNYCFLVGTLRDYWGREKYKSNNDLVDQYHPSEKYIYKTIEAMFQNSYPDLKLTVFKNKKTDYKRYELRSKALKDSIDSFFSFRYSGRGTAKEYIDYETVNIDSLMKSDDFYEKYYDSIFTGSLKQNVFKTKLQKLSFITGAYVRYGSQVDSLYQISVANSTSKVKTLEMLLNDVGCTNVNYEITPAIPYGHKVRFTPTAQLQEYFLNYKKNR